MWQSYMYSVLTPLLVVAWYVMICQILSRRSVCWTSVHRLLEPRHKVHTSASTIPDHHNKTYYMYLHNDAPTCTCSITSILHLTLVCEIKSPVDYHRDEGEDILVVTMEMMAVIWDVGKWKWWCIMPPLCILVKLNWTNPVVETRWMSDDRRHRLKPRAEANPRLRVIWSSTLTIDHDD